VGNAEVRDGSEGNYSGIMAARGIGFRGSYKSVALCDTENNCGSSGQGVGDARRRLEMTPLGVGRGRQECSECTAAPSLDADS
jgi:hypothetical protein